MPAIAGIANAPAAPLTASITARVGTLTCPRMTRTAAIPWVRAVTTCAVCRTAIRGSRSAITPPNIKHATVALVCTPSTRASEDA